MHSRVPKRAEADVEARKLLAEIPDWDDRLLLYMHRRFRTSRLFRLHHRPEGEMTPMAAQLLATADAEIARRNLAALPDTD